MSIPRPSRRLVLVAAVLVYWLVLFAATHKPIAPGSWLARISRPAGVAHLDKVQHVVAFAALAALLCAAAASYVHPSWRLYAGVFGVVALYGALDEWSQGLIDYRYPDVLDWVADVVGAAVGVLAFVVARRRWRRE
jgi:VanZ family protein